MSGPRIGDRSLFPTLQGRSYLNHAAVSPLSMPVAQAARAVLDDHAARGVGALLDAIPKRETLRAQLADWLGAAPADLGFPPGTTRGIVDLALAIDWKHGDRVLWFEGEFPANVLPWLRSTQPFGTTDISVPLTGFDDGSGDGLQRVEAALRGGVRLIAVSAVQFSTGLQMPVAALGALAHAHGAELFVDGIQALGGVPMPLDGVDYFVCGTHKWLMGLDGLAVAYAAPAARARLRPLTAGWLSTTEAFTFLMHGAGHLRYDRPLRDSLDWMEGGVQTAAAFAALGAAVSMLSAVGVADIAEHVQGLHDLLEPGLLARGFQSARAADPAARSNILSLRPPPGVDLSSLAERLGAQGVSVSIPDGWLRLAPHWPNSAAEVPFVHAAIDAAITS